jgi:predicted metal-dependent HD superfamily phosphohydrolase
MPGVFMFTIHPNAMQLLVPLYNSPQRYYHDMNHINFGLSKFAECRNSVTLSPKQEEAIVYSWWFHDAIYSPYPYYEHSSNELESAKLFNNWLYGTSDVSSDKKFVLHHYSAEIEHNIRATEKHLTYITEFRYDTTPILLDMDMAGFGRKFGQVYLDSDKIFEEYAELGLYKDVMIQNRITFLTSILKKPTIYYTEYFHNKYENIARNNIEGVIEASLQELAGV